MARSLKALSKSGEVANVDDVAVEIKVTRSVTDVTVCTPLEIKNKIAALDEDVAALNAKKTELEAELVEVTTAAQAVVA